MFLQVIRGPVQDVEGLQRLQERWTEELRPSAEGYLGTTSGVTPGGEFIALVRFRDEAAGVANAHRPEQSAWWSEAEKCFSAPPVFAGSDDVTLYLDGGTDSAGFVQVMIGRCVDRAKAEALEQEWVPKLAPLRPDLMGGFTAWHTDGTFTEVAYFTSEAEARAGEALELPEAVTNALAETNECYADISYFDLAEPWLS